MSSWAISYTMEDPCPSGKEEVTQQEQVGLYWNLKDSTERTVKVTKLLALFLSQVLFPFQPPLYPSSSSQPPHFHLVCDSIILHHFRRLQAQAQAPQDPDLRVPYCETHHILHQRGRESSTESCPRSGTRA
jgi:hypothetical protein